MHTKIVDPRGWNWDRPVSQIVKVSSAGLVGFDRSDFLKTASREFLHILDSVKIAKDEVPIHVLALGASEFWGSNRNGDGFKSATCRQCHASFVKNARWFYDHQNKDKSKSYGIVKASAYNEDMHRVELLVALNATKEAAERNGGLVAERTLQTLAKGKDPSASMACTIPHDICSNCGNKAKNRNEYCTAETCISPRGEKRSGCRDGLTSIYEDGHILHVDNPDPHWFDISDVIRPADRTAYASRATYLEKAASFGGFIPGSEAAELLGVTAPLHVIANISDARWLPHVNEQMKIAAGLAALETSNDLPSATYTALVAETPTEIIAGLGQPGTTKCAAALSAIADQQVILDFRSFAAWLGKTAHIDAAAGLLPRIYSSLVSLPEKIASNPFACSDGVAPSAFRLQVKRAASQLSLHEDAVLERVQRSTFKAASNPTLCGCINTDDREANVLAESYALYKLAALHHIASFDTNFNLTARLAVGQNRVI